MFWLAMAVTAWTLMLVTVGWDGIKNSWPGGIVAFFVVSIIDTVFIKTGSYSFSGFFFALDGIPVFYMLAAAAGGVILVHFLPKEKHYRIPYLAVAALIFLTIEYLAMRLGFFSPNRWDLLNSFWLNMGGFGLVILLTDWLKESSLAE